VQQSIQIYRDSSYPAIVVRRFHDWFELNRFLPIVLVVFVFPRFLAGLWVWRTGLITNPQPFLPLVRRVASGRSLPDSPPTAQCFTSASS
jgi:hypothetical protein